MYNTQMYDQDEYTIKLSRGTRAPRAQQLNENLMARRGGKMQNPKDVSRHKNKQRLRKDLMNVGNWDD